ncbi:MAG TPA: primary-amine oxidase, partial [Bryobacteraceae bacterium]|nr:primary-amine oxidase [Bryobacteraceae bacterium]
MATPTEVTPLNSKLSGAERSDAHPLDPLNVSELEQAVSILLREKYLGDGVRIASLNLIEPAKSVVENYKPESPFDRKALAVVLDRGKRAAYEAVVDLRGRSVESVKQLPSGIQPSIMLDEFSECEETVRRSPLFQEALKKRGVTDADLVMVEPWSAGMYGTELPEEQGLRRMRALCFVRSEPKDNGYARPIDSMVIVVDLYKMEVVRIEEYDIAPLPPEPGNWAREYIPNMRKDLKPVDIVQPEGPSFTVRGNQVEWQKWKFRVGFTSREGLVLHTVSYNDDGVERPILYRASICEMVVPYGDPGEQYYRKNAFDIGEYGLGMLANSLSLGCDCLGVIHYFDFPLVDSRGNVTPLKNAVCLHEEDFGILWKHTDWRTGQSEVRRSRRLSVSFIATVGNYEYAFYWYLYQDGSIQCEIKLTGIMNTTALAPGKTSAYGMEVAPQLNAPFHQHIFAARLIPSVDGPNNSVVEVNTVGVPTGASNP